ncbi:MAG: DUF4249 family protein [bacterium]
MRRLAWSVLPLVTLLVAACTFDQRAIGVPPAQLVVHSVLNESEFEQEVLVERTLTGSVFIADTRRFDPLDPINTGGGVPVTRATVTIAGPDGTFTGTELNYQGFPSQYGAGRYVVRMQVQAGARYILTVRASDGGIVTGSTVVPRTTALPLFAPELSFRRDRDTLTVSWAPVPLARAFGLRVDSPFGAFVLFTDSTHSSLPGDIRNVFASDLQHLFIPGFRQDYTVFAVDTNYFDYYRSRNDPFTGSGIINRLAGGIGVFGSVALLRSGAVDVTQSPVDPSIEGDYEIAQGPAQAIPYIDVMRLYVETPGATHASLSGWYSRNRRLSIRDGIAGTRDGTRIELTLLVNQDAHQHLATFVGTQVGDSLVGNYAGLTGRVVLRRRVVP